VAGKLATGSLETDEITASEGHFRRLFADTIDGLDDTIATVAGSLYDDLYLPSSEIDTSLSSELDASASALLAQSDDWLIGNPPASLELSSLDSAIITASDFLAVLGKASMVDVEITRELTINNTMHIADNSISVVCGGGFCDNTLRLQPTGMGRIDMLAGKFIINEDGDVRIAGDAYIAGKTTTNEFEVDKDATISGSLFANSLKPSNNDLNIELSSTSQSGQIHNSKFIIHNSNKDVASIDASGTAKFKKLMIAAAEATPSSEGFCPIPTGAHQQRSCWRSYLECRYKRSYYL